MAKDTRRGKRHRLLLIDDKKSTVACLKSMLESGDFDVTSAHDGEQGLALFEAQPFDVVVTDIRMAPVSGMELLEKIVAHDEAPPVVMMTALDELKTAATALQLGAFDYLVKPIQLSDLVLAMKRAIAYRNAKKGVLDLELVAGTYYRVGALVAQSVAMRDICEQVLGLASARSSVLIVGEPGTEKDVVAATIHDRSRNRDQPWLVVECGETAQAVGARVRAAAEDTETGRTVYLRELHALSKDEQTGLFRVLRPGGVRSAEEGKRGSSLRLLTSATADIERLVEAGEFSRELYALLAEAVIHVPPLRERREDILPIVLSVLRAETPEASALPALDMRACLVFDLYAWPGNFEELRDLLVSALATCSDNVVRLDQMPPQMLALAGDVPLMDPHDLEKEFLRGDFLRRFLSERGKDRFDKLIVDYREQKDTAERKAEARKNWAR